MGLQPAKGAVYLDSFVAMDDTIVDHTIHLQLVRFPGVSVKDDAAIPKQLVSKGLPFHLSDRSRSRSPFHCQLRV